MLPDPDGRSLAERIQDVLDAPVAAGLHSIAASNLDEGAPDEDALVCGDDADAKELALALAGSSSPVAPSTPDRSRVLERSKG